ncbi:uncharacterized protein LOC130670112 [Microplitis mediator]|uniref:uncharacterized protein LOC130670112 n=1 Tax=Microplitis mediator TaxID=375433 RepID=UPI0025551938|nr:uncharacterized protein LOC130670112 [Microplitis mediator]
MSLMDSSGLSKDDQDKLIKIQELTVILKETDKNLTACEDILKTYIENRLRDKKEEKRRHSNLENRMTEILDNLKNRLLIEQ